MVLTSAQSEFMSRVSYISMREAHMNKRYVYCPPNGLSPRVVEICGFRYRRQDIPMAYLRFVRPDGACSAYTTEAPVIWLKPCPKAFLDNFEPRRTFAHGHRMRLALEMKTQQKEVVVGQ